MRRVIFVRVGGEPVLVLARVGMVKADEEVFGAANRDRKEAS